jgi:hypothetical protein
MMLFEIFKVIIKYLHSTSNDVIGNESYWVVIRTFII